MKSLLIGVAGGAAVLLSDLYLFRWSADQQTIRLGLSVTAFLVVTAVASFLMDPLDTVEPVSPKYPKAKFGASDAVDPTGTDKSDSHSA